MERPLLLLYLIIIFSSPNWEKNECTVNILLPPFQNTCRILFWIGQKDFRPNTNPSPNTTFGKLTCDIPPLCEGGVHGAGRTGSNVPQRLFARSRNYFSSGYTSYDFVTAGPRCAITTALQPSTSIYRGLSAAPKVESLSS